MFRTLIVAVSLIASSASADMIRVESTHDVDTTIDRLSAAVEGAGAKVFARIEHAKGAASVGMELAPSAALIFGNPKLGTPALQGAPTMGVDLPLRVLAYEDNGKTIMVYHDPADVAALHGLPADHPVIAKMTGALAKLTGKAAGN
ncbi:MAG: DUF302 domain-containing protein [Paracoccaceae bacterium]